MLLLLLLLSLLCRRYCPLSYRCLPDMCCSCAAAAATVREFISCIRIYFFPLEPRPPHPVFCYISCSDPPNSRLFTHSSFSFFRLQLNKGRNKKIRLRRKMLRAQNRVLFCAHPASRRLLGKVAILTQMLRQRNSSIANLCPANHHQSVRNT